MSAGPDSGPTKLRLTWHDGPPWHEQLNFATSIYSETGDRRRKHHRKSRNGCAHCRKRRVKCSEDRPTCHDCNRLHVECQYPFWARMYRAESGATTTKQKRGDSKQRECRADATVSVPPAIQTLEWQGNLELDADLISFRPFVLSHALANLDHFVQCDRSWLKNSTIQYTMQHKAISKVTGQSYLLHAVLGVAAAHRAAICPEARSYNTVSLVHWQMFLRSYSRCLQGDPSSQDGDAIFFASHLHSILVSVHERYRDADGKWVLPAWIQSMKGVKALWDMPHIYAQLRVGVWRAWTQACEPDHQRVISGPDAEEPVRSSRALVALRDHCRLLPGAESRAYEERIDFLSVVENNLSSAQGLNCLSWYITRAPDEYLANLKRCDELSMLLLLHWCRLALRAGQWWLVQAASYESEKIHAYLSRTQSNRRISDLLDMIMGVCVEHDAS